MRKTIMILLFSAAVWAPMTAQVTIGSNNAPENGALLDLNTAFKGGLLLPNVVITDLGKIPTTFSDVSVQGADVVPALSGLVVYNTNEALADNIRIGFYYWDGNDWKLLAMDSGQIYIPANTKGYDPARPLGSDTDTEVSDILITNPGLSVTGAYTFSIIAGNEYASVSPQSSYDPKFDVSFMPNQTAVPRKAVVLVTDPSGKTGTFVFTQVGSTCESPVNVTITTLQNATEFCAGGSVHAYVDGVSAGVISDHDYYWTLNGISVAEGAGVELRQAGSYKVYADKIGCGTPAELQITGPSSSTASNAPRILVDNEGILCNSNPVRLTVLNAPGGGFFYWMKDGVRKSTGTSDTNYNIPASADNEGLWYVVYNDGTCNSTSSNKVLVSYQTNATTLHAISATINGTSITDDQGITICAGGTLKLEILNVGDYPDGATYEWFANGESLGKTTEATMYVVPPSVTRLVLSLTISAIGTCPMSVTSTEFAVLQSETPPPTSINSGDEYAYICGTNSAQLQASNASGAVYEWFWNGNLDTSLSGPQVNVTKTGKYSVRYQTLGGCWSTVSQEITVVQSSQLTAVWTVAPLETEIIGSNKTYSIAVAPEAQRFEWAPADPAHASVATITALGNGSSATVHYNEAAADYKIKVTAYNVCGNTVLESGIINVKKDCIPAGSLVITPNTAQTIMQGETLNFTASANTGSDDEDYPMTYTWYLDGSNQGTSTPDKKSFSYTTSNLTTVKPHTIQVRAQTACGSEVVSETVTVNVTINPQSVINGIAAHNTHFYGTKSCLDVHQTGDNGTNSWAGSKLPLNVRPNDFNNGSTLAFNYTFIGTSISNIRFIVSDAQNIVESVTGDANAASATAHLTFKNSIIASASGKTGAQSLKTTLYAIYNASGTDYKDSVVITVRDGACGCPAKASDNTYQMWSCHHLGANVNANPFVFNYDTHGYYWRFGKKNPASKYQNPAVAAGTVLTDGARNYTVDKGNGTTGNGNNWSIQNDPCPYGWRVATRSEWQNFGNHNEGTHTNPDGTENDGWLFGLYYPMVAHGEYDTGNGTGIEYPRECHNWTATSSTNSNAYNAIKNGDNNTWWGTGAWSSAPTPANSNWSKNYRETVRCISEGAAYTGY